MNVYTLINPKTAGVHRFASPTFKSVLVVGSWKKRTCMHNGDLHFELTPPLVVEWLPSSGKAGDVAWGYAGYNFICTSDVRSKLSLLGRHFRFETVIFKKVRKQKTPVEQQDYVWPVPRIGVSIDARANQLKERVLCGICGWRGFEFKIKGLLFNRNSARKAEVFYVPQLGKYSPIFVTESYREKLTQLGIENLGFARAGKLKLSTRTQN